MAGRGRSLEAVRNAKVSNLFVSNKRVSTRTGIKLLAAVGQGAAVVHRDLVALLCLALALDLVGDFDTEVSGGGTDGEGSDNGNEGGGLHACGGGVERWRCSTVRCVRCRIRIEMDKRATLG